MKPLLTLQNISFAYQNNSILENLSLSISPGEFLGILGPNGCGKTTLLRLMAGVLKPKSGEIQLLDQALENYSARDRAQKVAMVPQDFDVIFPFSALEVVLMGRWSYTKPFAWETREDIRIAKEAMEATDSLQFADRSIMELSGGERERVLIARALAQGSNILLLDGPTTHLDLKHQLQIYELLLKLNREREMTIVVVSHDLNFASMACQKILLLSEGRMVRFGAPDEVMDEGTLRAVFDAEVKVERRGGAGKPFYLPRIK